MRIRMIYDDEGDRRARRHPRPNDEDRNILLPNKVKEDARGLARDGGFSLGPMDDVLVAVIYWDHLVGASAVVPCDRWENGLYLEYYFDRDDGVWHLNDWGEAATPKEGG